MPIPLKTHNVTWLKVRELRSAYSLYSCSEGLLHLMYFFEESLKWWCAQEVPSEQNEGSLLTISTAVNVPLAGAITLSAFTQVHMTTKAVV